MATENLLFDTLPLPIVDLPADARHHTKGRQGFTPRIILIHHTGGTNSGKWLSTTSQPPVSTHRLISKKGINIKIVPDEDTAYCAGYGVVGPVDPDGNDPRGVAGNLNLITLHIELENRGDGKDPYPDEQLDMAAKQCAEWIGKYGYLAILGHMDVDANKSDPKGFSWPDFWRRLDLALITQRIEY